MDLLSIIGAVWRCKVATIPIILLTLLGAVYIVKVKPPVYEAQSTLLMLAAPGPPSASQIAADPKLRKQNSNNPYNGYGSLSVIADSVIETVTSAASQPALIRQGADPQYQLALSTDLSNPPIIDITGIGSSPQAAIRTANVVTRAAAADVYKLQQAQGTSPQFMIKPVQLVKPATASLSSSSKLRSLIAVLGLGAILLFVAISVTDALAKRRRNEDPVVADAPDGGPEYIHRRSALEARPTAYDARKGPGRYPEPRQARFARRAAAGRSGDDMP
jgi:capsular polysaccharide biosynthesis protein